MRKPKFKVASTTVRVAGNTVEQVDHLSRLLDDGYTVYAEAIAVVDGVVKQFRVTYTLEGVSVSEAGFMSDRPAVAEAGTAIASTEEDDLEPRITSSVAVATAVLPFEWLDLEDDRVSASPEQADVEDSAGSGTADQTRAVDNLEEGVCLNNRCGLMKLEPLETRHIQVIGIENSGANGFQPGLDPTCFCGLSASLVKETAERAGSVIEAEGLQLGEEEVIDELDQLIKQLGLDETASAEKNLNEAFSEAFRSASETLEPVTASTSSCVYQDHRAAKSAVEQHTAELIEFSRQLFEAWRILSHEIWGQAVLIDQIYEAFSSMPPISFLERLATLNAQASLIEGIKLHLSDRPTEGDRHAVGGQLYSGISFSRVLKSQPKQNTASQKTSVQRNPTALAFQPISHPPVTPLGQLVQQLSQPATDQELEFIKRLKRHSLGDTDAVQQPEGEEIPAGEGEDGTQKRLMPWLS